jgi:hypothetical protein
MRDTPTSSRLPGELDELLHRLECWPHLGLERCGACVTLRVRDDVIGVLNLETCALTAYVPAEMVSPLLENDPQLRGTSDGASVHVTDAETRRAAESLMRWRIELERFGPQLREASP